MDPRDALPHALSRVVLHTQLDDVQFDNLHNHRMNANIVSI